MGRKLSAGHLPAWPEALESPLPRHGGVSVCGRLGKTLASLGPRACVVFTVGPLSEGHLPVCLPAPSADGRTESLRSEPGSALPPADPAA